MENNILFLYQKINKQLLKEILFFFPLKEFLLITSKCPDVQYISLTKEYLGLESFDNMNFVLLKMIRKYPEQIIYLNENIFLPIYSVCANEIITPHMKDYNNSFYVNEWLFNPETLNMQLYLIGGIYYNVKVDDYYSFVKNFKLPFQSIKEDYITKHMPKLSKILKENNIDFSDFDYYRFHRDLAAFEKRDIRKQKLKFINIKNEVVQFFKKNLYYTSCFVAGDGDNLSTQELIIESMRFYIMEKQTLKFVIKNFKFCMLSKHFTFDIFCVNKDNYKIEDAYYIKEKCLEKEKKVSHTYNKDGIEIIEYYNNDEENEINPIITVTSSNELDYFNYDLNHYRFGSYIIFLYRKKTEEDRLPKILTYGALINV